MNGYRSLLAATVLLCVLAAACEQDVASRPPAAVSPTPEAESSPRPAPSSPVGAWILESGSSPEGKIPIVEDWDITLQIAKGRIGGRSACNSYGGRVKINGSTFDVRGLGGTLIGCEGDVARAEDRYLDAIQQADSIERRGDMLRITGKRVELVFRKLMQPPTARIVSRTWQLESFFEATRGDRTLSSAAPATLRLSRDGTFTGSTGCRRLEGEWIENVGEILFTSMEAIGRCTEGLSSQDNHVVGVLGDGFTARIDRKPGSDELRIVNARGGAGLVYRGD